MKKPKTFEDFKDMLNSKDETSILVGLGMVLHGANIENMCNMQLEIFQLKFENWRIIEAARCIWSLDRIHMQVYIKNKLKNQLELINKSKTIKKTQK